MRHVISNCRGVTITSKCILTPFALLAVIASATQASGSGRYGSYLAVKGGIYSPSATFNLANADVETSFDGDTKTGFSSEIALGHYFLLTLALELGIGYFRGNGSIEGAEATASGCRAEDNVIPAIVSAKALIPVGPRHPYGEPGIAASTSQLDLNDNLNTFDGTTTFGIQTGAGLNDNFSRNILIEVEGRYVWADPSLGDQRITLNDDDYEQDGSTLDGFTTTFALGFSF